MTYDRKRLLFEIYDRLNRTPRITLLEISQEYRLNRSTLENIIHETDGRSFRVLQTEATLRRFLELLTQNPSFSGKQIAVELGYLSPEAFCRFVKTLTKRSPTEIRQSPRIQRLLQKRLDGLKIRQKC